MTTPHTILLLGRTGIVLDDVRAALGRDDLRLFGGTQLADVEAILAAEPVDTVIMGAGIDLEIRLAIVEHIFRTSTATTVHMKDWDSGPAGMFPFVAGVLDGLHR